MRIPYASRGLQACLPLAALWLGLSVFAAGAPCDNPVAAFYSGPEGYPAWTDAIHWANVLDMKTYAKGANDFEKFENARDELAAKGGGVLYYPAGTYDFSAMPADGPQGRGLMLRSGIVIRGEAPAGHPVAAKDGKLELPTKFRFGFQKKSGGQGDAAWQGEVPRDWNVISLKPEPGRTLKDVDYVGLCWVHLDGAVICFGPEMTWGADWKTANDYKGPNVKDKWAARKPDGTHPYDAFMGAVKFENGGKVVGAGKGRLIFGCVLERAAVLNDFETCGRKEAPEGFGPNGFHMAKFTGRLAAYGSRVFVANNLLPKSPGNFKYPQTTVTTMARRGNDFAIGKPAPVTVLWDYGRTMGIDVNKDMWGLVGTSAKEPDNGYHLPGVVVQDNYVWNHGQKGFNLSANWGVIRNNHNERVFLKGGDDIYGLGGGWTLTLDGFIQSAPGGGGMISDNLSRAFDLAGRNLWVDRNFYNNTGSSPGIDGEGILCQGFGGTYWRSWALTHNLHEKGTGHASYMGGYKVGTWGALIAWNKTPGWVGTLSPPESADMAFIANEAGGVKGGEKALTESKGVPSAPKDVKAEMFGGDAVRVTWTDTADNEIGFRVDRRSGDGPWVGIAYRPPQIEKHADNPPEWVDFLAPAGKTLTYRVAAINADDDEKGASAPTAPLTLSAVSTQPLR